jgi:hypothetical protein
LHVYTLCIGRIYIVRRWKKMTLFGAGMCMLSLLKGEDSTRLRCLKIMPDWATEINTKKKKN